MEMNVPEQEGPPPKRMRIGDDSLQNDQMSEVEMTEQFESDENLKQFNFHDANRMFFWSFKPLFALMDKRELSELNKKVRFKDALNCTSLFLKSTDCYHFRAIPTPPSRGAVLVEDGNGLLCRGFDQRGVSVALVVV